MSRPKHRYDPGSKPYARRPAESAPDARTFPVGSTRADRRRRAKLPIAEQYKLAKQMKFRVPPVPTEVITWDYWIMLWEKGYAER